MEGDRDRFRVDVLRLALLFTELLAKGFVQVLGRLAVYLATEDIAHGVEDDVRLLLGVVPDELGLVLSPDDNSHLVRPGGRDEVIQPLNKYSGQLIQQDATLSFSLVVDELEHPGSE